MSTTDLTFGGLDENRGYDGGFKTEDIPEVHALETVTGRKLQEVLDEQALATRAQCSARVCGAFATAYSRMDSVSIDTNMGGYVQGQRAFVDIESGCRKGNCPSSELASGLSERLEALFGVCMAAVEEAREQTEDLRDAGADRARKILDSAKEQAEKVHEDTKAEAALIAQQIYDRTMAEFSGEAAAQTVS